MRYRSGGSDRGRAGRGRAGGKIGRAAAVRRARGVADAQGDICAMRLTEGLEDAVLALDTQPAGFEDAVRKADHVEELRRILGILLDVLADWEMLADREARGP
ncbi:hypothetical protein [Actinoallomurus sp. NPDC050550]|uniref:hypothetical protein n=1 Tax=Actinoallomurus sp. NPDC050550 TaxID=3154937 RepID=UPI00340752A7